MEVIVVSEYGSSDFEKRLNTIIMVNKGSDIEIKYSTCTRSGGGVHHSAIVIITPKKPKNIN